MPHRRDCGNVSEEDRIVDWTLCCLCEEQTNEKPQCSTSVTLSDPQNAYRELADGIKAFQPIEMTSMPLNVSALECDTDLNQSFYAISAKFHKSCKLRFAQVKLDRAIKLVEKQESTCNSVKDSKRGNFIPYSFSPETTSPFSPQRFPTSLLALKFSYECLIFMFTSSTT